VIDPDRLLEALDPEQREVATALRGPICVVAGAGTGKTRAITHRIAYGVASGVYVPSQVLAVTFTTRAAGEMRGRLRELGVDGVQVRTFHSAALRQARYFWPQVYGGPLPELIVSKLSMLSEAASRCRLSADASLLRDLAGEIEWAKVSNVTPETYAGLAAGQDRDSAGLDHATVGRVFGAYEDVKRERNRLDMEDILLCAAAVLTDDEGVAVTVRRQYRWFVVDEFQDVSPIQVALLDLWLGGRDDVCVVGDPMQTIYSFAGASPDYLTGFATRHPGAHRLELVRNYRSTPEVVTAANRVAHGTKGRRRGSGPVVLQAQRESGAAVRCAGHAHELDEAEAVAGEIARLRDSGTALRDIAVLFRVNAQSEAYEEALAALGIGYVVRGLERFFDRPEVKQALTLLRGAARAGESTGDVVGDVRAVLSSMGWTPEAPAGSGAQRDRWESLQALVALAEELSGSEGSTDLAGLVSELERRAHAQHAPVADGVTLATLHAAKGLEWSHVFVVGAHEGTVPFVYAKTPAAIEEERRLFYVGVTRARDALHVSWSAARSPGSRGSRSPSRFLDGIRPADSDGPPARHQTARGSRSGRQVARCRTCDRPLTSAVDRKIGRCDACPATYDEVLFERLRSWRTEQASAQRLPAYCVFTDATLTAIAETLPSDAASLMRVPGVGKAKLDKYGADVIAICADDAG
jgi:DNA helicase-2/ATP-dependent DNA helicase PcrA